MRRGRRSSASAAASGRSSAARAIPTARTSARRARRRPTRSPFEVVVPEEQGRPARRASRAADRQRLLGVLELPEVRLHDELRAGRRGPRRPTTGRSRGTARRRPVPDLRRRDRAAGAAGRLASGARLRRAAGPGGARAAGAWRGGRRGGGARRGGPAADPEPGGTRPERATRRAARRPTPPAVRRRGVRTRDDATTGPDRVARFLALARGPRHVARTRSARTSGRRGLSRLAGGPRRRLADARRGASCAPISRSSATAGRAQLGRPAARGDPLVPSLCRARAAWRRATRGARSRRRACRGACRGSSRWTRWSGCSRRSTTDSTRPSGARRRPRAGA